MKKKNNTERRMCIDFRELNKHIERENYPIPVIEDAIEELVRKKYFSMLDLKDGFYHVSVAEESVKFTSFTSPLGQYEFIKMPFGIKIAPSCFQRFVNEVMRELVDEKVLKVYIDDFLIATETIEQHLEVLNRVFKLLVDIS